MTEAKITRRLEYRLTAKELRANDALLREALQKQRRDENILAILLDDVKNKKREIKTNLAYIRTLQSKWETQCDERDVDCEIRFNTPEPGKKVIIRLDSMEQVGDPEEMTDEEKNDLLNQTDGSKEIPDLSFHIFYKNKNNDFCFVVMRNFATICREVYCKEAYSAAIAHANQLIYFDFRGKANVIWHDEVRNTKTFEEAVCLCKKSVAAAEKAQRNADPSDRSDQSDNQTV